MTELTLELPNFEGPLDLLLHLIKEQKIDIYDIPIAKITQQYLSYIEHWQRMNLKIAGEYFVMSSTLLRIKSQMLLPQNDFTPEDEEADPREELVEQLVQYSVFKKVAAYFKKRNDEVPFTAAKEASVQKGKGILPLPAGQLSAAELANTFSLLMRRYRLTQPNVAAIKVKQVSVTEMTTLIKKRFKQQSRLSFFKLSTELASLDDVISLFLAVLALCKSQFLQVKQDQTFADLILKKMKTDG